MSHRFATVTQFTISLVLSIALTVRSGTMCGSASSASGVARGRRLGAHLVGRMRAMRGDAGMSTAEYAVGTIAACAFAAVLFQVVTGDSIVSALRGLITSALSALS